MGLRRRFDNVLRALAGIESPSRIPAPEVTSHFDPEILKGSTALVTGAGRNIGQAIALEMARHGATVVGVDNDATRLAALEELLYRVAPGSHEGHQVDLSEIDAIDRLVDRLQAGGVEIDVLVNNVGVGDNVHRLADLDVEHWQRQFQTNVFGPLHLTRGIVQPLVEGGRTGSVLFITSMHQDLPSRNPAYSTTKAALGMLVRELAIELSGAGIRVNGLAPGWTTGQVDHPAGHQGYVLLGGNPIPPRYIGRAAVYLSADFFSLYTTGTVLTIDAGLGLYGYRTAEVPPPSGEPAER